MSKDRARPPAGRAPSQQMRQRIAAAAARIMAEDGVDDYALAKRKAARQLGAGDTRSLPGNEEIELELRAYQSLYQGDEQRERVRELRLAALQAMRAFAEFRPYLAGPVLKGTAGRYSGIELQLFTDNSKAVEMLLLNRGVPYEIADTRSYAGDQARAVPVLTLEWEGVPARLAIYPANDERGTVRSNAGGRAIERVGVHALEQLIEQDAH